MAFRLCSLKRLRHGGAEAPSEVNGEQAGAHTGDDVEHGAQGVARVDEGERLVREGCGIPERKVMLADATCVEAISAEATSVELG